PCPLRDLSKPETFVDALDPKVAWGSANYVNPPFSLAKQFVVRAVQEMKKGNKSILLLPSSRNNAKYWTDLVLPNACEIRLLTCKPFFQPEQRKDFRRGFP